MSDAVVIGSGPNGLVAANLLADAGWDVLVLEAAGEPGGAVRTVDSAAPGFRDDRFSSFYPLGIASPILSDLDLGRYGLRWRHAPAVLAHLLPDDRAAVLSRNIDVTAASVAEFAAADGDAWHAQFARWSTVRDDLLAAIFTPFPPVRAAVRLLRTLGLGETLRFGRLATSTVRSFGMQHFAGEGARLSLATHCTPTSARATHGAAGWSAGTG
jgi:phytoene dehydrogenase-like protein